MEGREEMTMIEQRQDMAWHTTVQYVLHTLCEAEGGEEFRTPNQQMCTKRTGDRVIEEMGN
jgi:hypothetical protein